MAAIPSTLSLVHVQFKDCVGNDIHKNLLQALEQIIRPGLSKKYILKSLLVSSAFDSHEKWPDSNHNKKTAVDISRINGKYILSGYKEDPEIIEIVQQIQKEFEKVKGRRENFGPYFKKKCGNPYKVAGHLDHIHISVNADGQSC